MAASTGIVVTAGGLALVDHIISGWQTEKGMRIAAGTVLAAFVSAGLDKAVPGLGTGGAVVLLASAVITYGPRLARAAKALDKR